MALRAVPRGRALDRDRLARATAARAGSRPPGSRPARRWRSSTSPSKRSVKKPVSSTSASSTSSTAARTSSCSGRPAPARRTCRSRSASAPASPATASRSAPRPSGSRCSPTPSARAPGARARRLAHRPLLIVDEVGYIPFDPQAANLMFMLVSRALRARQPDRHVQQAVLGLGRDLRRRRRRRRHDRPARPPRRDPRAQRRQLPPPRQGPGLPAAPRLSAPACSASPYGLASAGGTVTATRPFAGRSTFRLLPIPRGGVA